MDDLQTTSNSHREPVRLVTLAAELDVTPEALETELGGDVWRDAAGFRVVTLFKASETLRAHARRKEAAAAAGRRREAARRERFAAIASKRPVPRGVALEVPTDMLPAAVMASLDGPPRYDGGTYREVPGALDWQFNNAEGGSSIGPTPSQSREQARARAAKRKTSRG